MKINSILGILFCLILINSFCKCKPSITKNKNYLIIFTDSTTDNQGYKNIKGKIVIPAGKYSRCFTDTFKTYAIVIKENLGFIAIDFKENTLYEVFAFDNGPDEPSEGLFRIIRDKKIGYADSQTGKIVIKPQFDCAEPFNNGLAEVSNKCSTIQDGEHSIWQSEHWFYINKTGKRFEKQNN